MLTSLLASCGVLRMLPSGPVLSASKREAEFGTEAPSGADYEGLARSEAPPIGFLVFGAKYDLDIVLVSKNPEWNMHEYARLDTPDGELWIAKDSRESTGDQLIVGDFDGIETWLPEVPVARKRSPLEVVDHSEGDTLDLEFRYENYDGVEVDAHFRGAKPTTQMGKRNGSTMGHSRNQVLALLDLPLRDFGKEASMSFDGVDTPIERLLFVVPMRLALQQTQGGVPSADFTEASGPDGGFTTVHAMPDGAEATLSWEVTRPDDEHLVARQVTPLRTLTYRYRVVDADTYELVGASVTSWKGEEAFGIRLSPALPDLRRPFASACESRFVMDVAGHRNYAVGTIRAEPTEDGAKLTLQADRPWWAEERLVRSTVRYAGETAHVVTDVTPLRQ